MNRNVLLMLVPERKGNESDRNNYELMQYFSNVSYKGLVYANICGLHLLMVGLTRNEYIP